MILFNSLRGYSVPRDSRLKFLLVALCLTLGATQAVLAHSELVKTEPEDGQVLSESPGQVRVWFSEELDPNQSVLRVADSQGKQIDRGDSGLDLKDVEHALMVVSLPASLPAGTYTVGWTAASVEDGDTTTGAFNFVLQGAETNGPAPPAEGGSGGWMFVIIAAIFILILIVITLVARITAPPEQGTRS